MAHVGTALPPLYFQEHGEPLTTTTPNSDDENSALTVELVLPAEVLHRCYSYADWGDLAKLSCVQSQWSWMLRDAANSSIEAKWELSQAMLEGTNGLESNPAKAIQLMKELANADDSHNATNNNCFPPAMKQLALCYLNGTGTTKHLETGVAWMAKTHTLGGDMDAAHELALLYEYGHHGVEIDVVKAFEWFKKAAESGHCEAMAELALCYELGCGVEQSDTDALDWYMKAAEKGHLTAKFSVGEAFEEARGVPQSDEEACLWYFKAAVEGDEDSRKALRRLEDIARIVVPGVGRLLDE